MTRDNEMLALLESREAEANAKAEWIAEWCEHHAATLLAAKLEGAEPATLLAEVTADQWDDLNQAAYLLMVCGDKQPIMALLQQLIDSRLARLARDAWHEHVAQLHDAMSEEQFERYLQRSAA